MDGSNRQLTHGGSRAGSSSSNNNNSNKQAASSKFWDATECMPLKVDVKACARIILDNTGQMSRLVGFLRQAESYIQLKVGVKELCGKAWRNLAAPNNKSNIPHPAPHVPSIPHPTSCQKLKKTKRKPNKPMKKPKKTKGNPKKQCKMKSKSH